MTENYGCTATFDKDNKLQTQLTMNVIKLQTVHRQYRRYTAHSHCMEHYLLELSFFLDMPFSESDNAL